MSETYAHGHHASVVASHAMRTAENSAAYLLPHLVDGMRVLDVGSGPGTITTDLAERLPNGSVIGVDGAPGVVEEATQRANERGVENVSFQVGDAYALDFADGSFDVVTAHQMLHHLARPVEALREFRRVVKPDGIVAVREVDYAGVFWFPLLPGLDEWLRIMLQTGEKLGANFAAGRRLGSWAREAGFTDVTVTGSQWTYANPEQTAWWGESWARRALESSFATQALGLGLANSDDLQRVSDAWMQWAHTPGAFMQLPHGEIIARG